MNAGHEVSVFSRTAAKCAPLVERGAFPAATPAEASCNADVVFTMVGTPIDVETVILGDQGVLSALDPGAVVVDCTTSTPSLAVQVAAWAAAQGAHSLDAPVSGGDVGAEAGTLSIMCGGSEVAMSKTLPLLELMGRPRRMGGPGAGQHTKMANQILACSNMIGMTESLLYARKAGLDTEGVIAAIGSGAAGSWLINNLGLRQSRGDFAPGFMIEHMAKDLGIALAEANRMQLELPGLELAERLYAGLMLQGHGKDGTQALVLALDDMLHQDER
uniref:6-phosphogluconate dehydrogenase NADP-binding domain-containing protein n=1 Tax=Haptolina ericina TaxID=156174 RepID=A0A7S3EUF2_9EUKA